MVVDIGTGDGRSVLRRAAAEPRSLCIGIDAVAAAMADASRRAARGRLGNAVFLVGGAVTLGGSPLRGAAELVTVTFPWASLLRGVLGLAEASATLDGVAATLTEGGTLEVLASVVPTDGIPGLGSLSATADREIAAAWAQAGLVLTGMQPATAADIDASGSTWARRLSAGRHGSLGAHRSMERHGSMGRRGPLGRDRPVWRLTGHRAVGGPVRSPARSAR